MKEFKFKINGNEYQVEIENLEDNIAKIEVNGTVYEVEIDKKINTPKTPKLVRTSMPTPTEAEQNLSKVQTSAGVGKIKSPLPGVILEIYVKVGDIVKVGDKILMLEAMKMENNINADKDGKIIAIPIHKGDSVMEGDVLIEIGV